MTRMAQFFLTNYKFSMVLTFFSLIFGVSGFLSINSETFPTVNIGAVVITTTYGGATADDIETKITKPIEEEIQKVSGLKKVKSVSQAGFSTVVTEVDIDKYNVVEVIADLQRAVDRAILPTDLLSPPLFTEIKSEEFPVVEIAVIGSNENRKRDSVVDQLKEDLQDNKKVSSVALSGFRERQFNIFLDREALLKNHVAISEVERALQFRNVTIPGGEIKGVETQKLIRIEGKAESGSEIGEIVVRSNFSGQRVLLKDVATIEDGEKNAETLVRHKGESAVFLTVAKKGGADLLEMEKEIQVLLDQYRAKHKDQLKFEIYNNEALRVLDRLNVLISNGWQGLILVVVILMIFIKGRVGLMASLSLPLALAITLGVVNSIGYTLNTITIIGFIISLGMLVDNAVVISENYMRLKGEGVETEPALIKSIQDLWAPITATVLTTVAAFLPMLVTAGVMGQFIKGIPIVVTIALMVSLIEGFILLPARLKLINPKFKPGVKMDKGPDWFDRRVVPVFEQQVKWLVANKWKSFGVFSGTLALAIVLLATGVKVNLFPDDQTEIYVGRVETKTGTRLELTDVITAGVVKQVQEKLGERIVHIVQKAGTSVVDPSDPKGQVGANTALIVIFVDKDTQFNVATQEVLRKLREVKDERLVRLTFEALVNGPPVGEPVAVTLRSNDMVQLAKVANILKDKISATPGVFDARVDDVIGDDEVIVNVNYERAARLGISLFDIGSTIRTAVAGQEISDVNLNNREVAYNLRFADLNRDDLDELKKIKIADPTGNLIPLGNLASFKVQSGTPQIKRYDFRRAKTVLANLDTDVISSPQANALVAEEFEKIKSDFKDVSLVFGGEQEDTNESFASLLQALVLSLIGIFALMVLVFRSFSSPFIILTTIPLGLVGVAIGFFIQGKVLSFMAFVGIVGVGGIIVNSGIILISFIEQLREKSGLSADEILVKAASLRLRSVIVTTVTTVLGLVPTAYGIGGSDFFIIPMALSILWGLAVGTLLTLYWVPPAYAIVTSLKEKFKSSMGGAHV
jgi:multidrug efflux pump subunit AcrB